MKTRLIVTIATIAILASCVTRYPKAEGYVPFTSEYEIVDIDRGSRHGKIPDEVKTDWFDTLTLEPALDLTKKRINFHTPYILVITTNENGHTVTTVSDAHQESICFKIAEGLFIDANGNLFFSLESHVPEANKSNYTVSSKQRNKDQRKIVEVVDGAMTIYNTVFGIAKKQVIEKESKKDGTVYRASDGAYLASEEGYGALALVPLFQKYRLRSYMIDQGTVIAGRKEFRLTEGGKVLFIGSDHTQYGFPRVGIFSDPYDHQVELMLIVENGGLSVYSGREKMLALSARSKREVKYFLEGRLFKTPDGFIYYREDLTSIEHDVTSVVLGERTVNVGSMEYIYSY